jgi:ubiquitin-protein ligase
MLNIYSIEKKPPIEKLIQKIYLKIKDKSTNTDIKKTNNINLELLYIEEKDRINNLTYETRHIDIKNVKKIFSDSIIKDIIINEYMKTWKKYYNSDIKINTNDLYNFEVEFLNIKDNLKNVKMNIILNSKYYPNYPPIVNITYPELANSMIHRISNSKMFQFDYWNPSISIIECIEYVKNILVKHAQPITDNINIKEKIKIDLTLNQNLLLLTNYIQIDDDIIDLDREFIKFNYKNSTKQLKKKDDKFNGTGYRFGEDTKWKIEDYEKIQKEREEELLIILMQIATSIQTLDKIIIANTISNSLLIKFLIKLFSETTLLDMTKRTNLFNVCIDIIQNLAIEECSHLLNYKYNSNTLFTVIEKLYNTIQLSIKYDNTNLISNSLIFVWSMLEPLYIKSKDYAQSIKYSQTIDVSKDLEPKEAYIKELTNLRFDTNNIIESYKKDYKTTLIGTKTSTACMKRLSSEIPTLASDLPINIGASIFLRVDEQYPRAMRAIISGPADTPYESGLFVFDIYLPPNYPTEVPCINFMNTGNVRFNPNLYHCGKVCLSILGTYIGPSTSQAEKWNTSSTLYQVLISIQSQILVEHPIFNEPGFQQYYKTERGDKETKIYNDNVRLYTMKYCMLDLLSNKHLYPEFRNIISAHFKIKKNKIIETINKWKSETKLKSEYETVISKLELELNKL